MWTTKKSQHEGYFFLNQLEYKLVAVEIRAEQWQREKERERERERERASRYERPNIVVSGVMLSLDLNRTGL